MIWFNEKNSPTINFVRFGFQVHDNQSCFIIMKRLWRLALPVNLRIISKCTFLVVAGGDEARVARAGGSGRGAPCSTLANGTPSPRTLPPRAGWAVRTTNTVHSSPLLPAKAAATTSTTTPGATAAAAQWGSGRSPSSTLSSKRSPIASTTNALDSTNDRHNNQQLDHHLQQRLLTNCAVAPGGARSCRTDSLDSRGGSVLMSRNAPSPPSRPPSSASSVSTSSRNLARVHGHDHSRPLPPPRLSDLTGTSNFVPLTAPLAPLSTSNSFRTNSRTPVTTSNRSQNGDTIISSADLGTGIGTTRSRSSNETPRSPVGEVTLTVPRPDGDRIVNEYVETPFRPIIVQNQGRVSADGSKCAKNERWLQQQQKAQEYHNRNVHRRQNQLLQSSSTVGNAITKQPVSFTKEPSNALGSPNARSGDPPVVSVICVVCGRCKCESCREPLPMPSGWLCEDSCFCSPETALDYISCLCCVKGLFYHCNDSGSGVESEGGSCADEPCSCTGSRKTARWACLGALTFVLPCLLCYLPCKACVATCEACYIRLTTEGCRCDPTVLARHNPGVGVLRDSRDPEKRLLDPVTPEL